MALTFTPLHPVFAAEASGVDIAEPLSPEAATAIEAAMDRYAVLVFRRDEPLAIERQVAFSTNFGPLEAPYRSITSSTGGGDQRAEIIDISNLGHDGKPMSREDRRRLFSLGNQLWHSDSSYKPTPAKYSLLSAHIIPPEGGETEFADMRAAWDALDERTKAKVRDLVCEHSRLFSKGELGFDFTEDERRDFAPVKQRLVRRHPGSGRLSLFLSSHIGRIVGWPVPEARMLIRELTEHATQRDFVYRHEWRVGDLVVWDNRCTMHRGRPYDDLAHPRDLRRTTLADSAPTLEQPA